MSWYDAGPLSGIPARGARVIALGDERIALFRTGDGQVFALRDSCPHQGGPLSQGIVHGHRVTCPLHDWVIELGSGEAVAPDRGCTRVFEVRVEAERILVNIPEASRDAPEAATRDASSEAVKCA